MKKGFTLIELLIVIIIVGILASFMFIAFTGIRAKARDTKRKAELSNIARFFTTSCYVPDAGVGSYDLTDLLNEFKAKDDKYKNYLAVNLQDPKTGSQEKSNYLYIVNEAKKCVLYANLESDSEPVTLNDLTNPTPGGGNGVFASSTKGWNGSTKYYQISN